MCRVSVLPFVSPGAVVSPSWSAIYHPPQSSECNKRVRQLPDDEKGLYTIAGPHGNPGL